MNTHNHDTCGPHQLHNTQNQAHLMGPVSPYDTRVISCPTVNHFTLCHMLIVQRSLALILSWHLLSTSCVTFYSFDKKFEEAIDSVGISTLNQKFFYQFFFMFCISLIEDEICFEKLPFSPI